MEDRRLQIHAKEFAAHLALHSAAPVWLVLFGTQIPAAEIERAQESLVIGTGLNDRADVENFAGRMLGQAAVDWMHNWFLSSAIPRYANQRAVLDAFFRPVLSPATYAFESAQLMTRLPPERLIQLDILETLLADRKSVV